ncbi:NTP transferase domain-containing protein [Microbacterium sp. BWT-B31]|uniref:molybdenum cofactor guanylyltransferase n=1 Tax=Microbacterium sp. BWT-B31 TaxID=3232072 RepID=UPI0035273218
MTASRGAILLAGGRASRVGGAAKPLFEVGGRTLLAAAIDAVTDASARPITICGPPPDPAPGLKLTGIDVVREHPPFGGPVAGAVAVLRAWRERGDLPEWTFLLACDLPGIGLAVSRLARDAALLPRDADGVCLGDASSRPQWLTGLYRTAALAEAGDRLDHDGRDAPVRLLVADLAITVLAAPDLETTDVDTWEDLTWARAAFGGPPSDNSRSDRV